MWEQDGSIITRAGEGTKAVKRGKSACLSLINNPCGYKMTNLCEYMNENLSVGMCKCAKTHH